MAPGAQPVDLAKGRSPPSIRLREGGSKSPREPVRVPVCGWPGGLPGLGPSRERDAGAVPIVARVERIRDWNEERKDRRRYREQVRRTGRRPLPAEEQGGVAGISNDHLPANGNGPSTPMSGPAPRKLARVSRNVESVVEKLVIAGKPGNATPVLVAARTSELELRVTNSATRRLAAYARDGFLACCETAATAGTTELSCCDRAPVLAGSLVARSPCDCERAEPLSTLPVGSETPAARTDARPARS
ncbi:hypothetical protein ACVWWO_002969 [Bradyrhizobium sp. F1.13.1]